jgi:hypothetical protein
MTSLKGRNVRTTVFAALMIIGCSISSMAIRRQRIVVQNKQLDEAVQAWEGEGGAVPVEQEEADPIHS